MDISSEGLEVVFLDQKAPIFCETSSRIGGVFHPCAFAEENQSERSSVFGGISLHLYASLMSTHMQSRILHWKLKPWKLPFFSNVWLCRRLLM